jgi:hypothetical protein
MAKSANLSLNAEKRVKVIYHEEDGRTYVEHRQDVDALGKAASILADRPPDPETGMRFVCFIDDATWARAIAEGWMHDKAAWRKYARENRFLNGGRSNPF